MTRTYHPHDPRSDGGPEPADVALDLCRDGLGPTDLYIGLTDRFGYLMPSDIGSLLRDMRDSGELIHRTGKGGEYLLVSAPRCPDCGQLPCRGEYLASIYGRAQILKCGEGR